uniref:Prothymosin alpha n=1 Tax=Ascaris lumbricoides TaxID=6252 RepID=A0A0M3IBK3_ASCLU
MPLLFRFVVVKIRANCCPKVLQIVLDTLSGSELSSYVVRPPRVVKYCTFKREFCSDSGEFRKGEDATAAKATERTEEEKFDQIVNTPNWDENNTDEGEVKNDEEVSKEVSDSDETTSQTDEENDDQSEQRKL